MNKQDWYLNKLGITQYVLRNPNALKGISADIAQNIRLIVVAKHQPTEKIFQDILNAIHVSNEDCLHLTPAQLIMPIEQIKHVIWFINTPLPDCWLSSDQLKNKAIIKTTSLIQLSESPNQKRQLWQTLCQYENYLSSH